MRVTLDRDADAAYIYLLDGSYEGRVHRTESLPDEMVGGPGMINLDFDVMGHIIGIELIGASELLPGELEAQADRGA